ncbi:DUF3971 domain-containing protein [Donghicola tyrosinivorans]|uniref:AsmA-like protein n=1 Tax=Donghicola tyrosinivorans TaxID=1652492 RepID=A0A2T0X594_9RHOB|nr:DUF3971 domain-containing protein [Donghicola tyrosinivorans]PRY94109.1 AsmA-like protein [Donghicola tyrosinivorans]
MNEKKETEGEKPAVGDKASGAEQAEQVSIKASEKAIAQDAPKAEAREDKRRRPLLTALVVVFVLLVLIPVGGALTLLDRQIRLPDWAEARLEGALARQGTGARVALGEIYLTVDHSLRPWVELRDTAIQDKEGAVLARVGQMRVNLSGRSLLRRVVAAEHIEVTGIVVDLTRNREGAFDLAFSAGDVPVERSISFTDLMKNMDLALATPELSALRTVEARAMTLRYSDLRAERSWTMDGGRVTVVRKGESLRIDTALTLLTGGADAATLEAFYERTLGQHDAEFGINISDLLAQDIATQLPATAFLGALEAPLSGSMRGQVDARGNLDALSASLVIGAGALRPNNNTVPLPFDSARTYFTYDPKAQVLTFDELSVKSAWISGSVEGSALLVWPEGANWPSGLETQFTISALSVETADLLPQPVSIARANAALRFHMRPFALQIGQLELVVDGQPISLRGDVKALPEGWSVGILAEGSDLTVETVMAHWPERAVPKTREWVAANVLGGTLEDVQFYLTAAPGQKPQPHLEFSYEDATVRFLGTMPPITEGYGRATLADKRFAVRLDQGTVTPSVGGPVDAAGTRFEIPLLKPRDPEAFVDLNLEGTVTSMLSLLDSPKLEVMSKANLPVTLADGQASVTGRIDLKLMKNLPKEDLRYDIIGLTRDVRTTKLVPGRTLAAPSLKVHATPGSVVINGKGRFGAVPFDGTFTLAEGKIPRVNAQVELSERTLDELNIDLGDVRITGQGLVQLDLALPKGAPVEFGLKSNLKGLSMGLESLGWSKGKDTAGTLAVSGTINPVRVPRLSFDAAGLLLNGRVDTDAAGKVNKVVFDRVRAGNWLDSPVTLTMNSGSAPPLISLSDGKVDIRKMPKSKPSKKETSPIRLSNMRLQFADTMWLGSANGDLATTGGARGTIEAKMNGNAPLSVRIAPSGPGTALNVTSRDGGDVMRDAGILAHANGGVMQLTMTPVDDAGTYDGVLSISETRVYDAPTVTALLNAMSVVGLLDQMANGGIYFSSVDAKFRLMPKRLILQQASAIGPSMGLSLDGVIDLASKRLDLQGVLSPIYMLNGIGNIFSSRQGEGLFGFNFTLQGPTEAPQVGVNPLSVLTPGMFREIFRRPPPSVTQ